MVWGEIERSAVTVGEDRRREDETPRGAIEWCTVDAPMRWMDVSMIIGAARRD
jgi:hypothetical protein